MKKFSYADLSTAHVSRADMQKIEAQGEGRREGLRVVFTVYEYSEGAFLPLINEPCFAEELKSAGMSKGFIALCKKLMKQGFTMLRLDCDGEVDKGLRVFDW